MKLKIEWTKDGLLSIQIYEKLEGFESSNLTDFIYLNKEQVEELKKFLYSSD